MIIGLPKEVKNNEYRVALTPGGVKQLVDAGHQVLVEAGAGVGACGLGLPKISSVGRNSSPVPGCSHAGSSSPCPGAGAVAGAAPR